MISIYCEPIICTRNIAHPMACMSYLHLGASDQPRDNHLLRSRLVAARTSFAQLGLHKHTRFASANEKRSVKLPPISAGQRRVDSSKAGSRFERLSLAVVRSLVEHSKESSQTVELTTFSHYSSQSAPPDQKHAARSNLTHTDLFETAW